MEIPQEFILDSGLKIYQKFYDEHDKLAMSEVVKTVYIKVSWYF